MGLEEQVPEAGLLQHHERGDPGRGEWAKPGERDPRAGWGGVERGQNESRGFATSRTYASGGNAMY